MSYEHCSHCQEYHGISADAKHTSDMDASKVVGNINPEVPVHSTRIRVGRNIDGFGLSPGITKQQRIDIEKLMSSALSKLGGDLAGKYYPLTGMDEAVRQQLVDDHFLFMSGDRNLQVRPWFFISINFDLIFIHESNMVVINCLATYRVLN